MTTNCSTTVLLICFVVVPGLAFGQELIPKSASVGDGVALHYVERGDGEPIIFVHGLLSDASFWTRQLDGFADAGFRAIAYSRRYNSPNENKLRPNHSAAVEAEDLAALIAHLELENAHIVGYSYGAYTALMLALERPDLVRTLTLGEPPIASWLADLPGEQSEAGRSHLTKLMGRGVIPTKAAFESGMDETALRTMFDCIGGDGAFDRLPAFVKNKCWQNIVELKAIVSSNDPYPSVDREEVRRLDVPTLIMSGSESIATAKFTDPELERLIPKRLRKRVVLQGATHIMWVEQPVRSREVVLEFIREQ